MGVTLLKWLVAAAAAGLLAWPAFAQPAPDRSEASALREFDAAIAGYLDLRRRLLAETSGPAANSTAAQITQASDALAAAIQRARRGARQGDIFSIPVSEVFKRRIAGILQREDLAQVFANIDDEPPTVKSPAIHLRFPGAAQMATMPPSLLAALPTLPEALEYRVVGNALVLRDAAAGLIIDLIPAAVPR
jgi:hypothetical protein